LSKGFEKRKKVSQRKPVTVIALSFRTHLSKLSKIRKKFNKKKKKSFVTNAKTFLQKRAFKDCQMKKHTKNTICDFLPFISLAFALENPCTSFVFAFLFLKNFGG